MNNEHNGGVRSEVVEAGETTDNRDGDRIRSNRSNERENAENGTASGDVEDEHGVVATFVCDLCNKVCLSAAGLGSHRRVHRSK